MSTAIQNRTSEELLQASSFPDEEIINRVQNGDLALFEIVMRRYNQRLYRIIRAIIENDHEAEEVVQEAYVRAYMHLHQFEGRAQFSTWLTKIAIYQAYAHKRRLRREVTVGHMNEPINARDPGCTECDPEKNAVSAGIRAVLESAIQDLPDIYRTVFVMRTVEEMTTSEVAECLGISEQNVKTRLLRGRALLRRRLTTRFSSSANRTFEFLGSRCDRIVQGVFAKIFDLRSRKL
jgi:RNA polymerase sigma-70 factor (ECF subfamily)